jgi:parallel beta-helix repeat protein
MLIQFLFIFAVLSSSVFGYEVYFIGDHPQATHYVKEKTDIYNVTQSLLDVIARSPDGGRITFANGTYLLSKNIQLGNNVHLNGFGMFETILQLDDFAKKFTKAGFVRTVRTNNILISNLTLDGNKHRQIIDGVDNTLPKNVSYTSSTKYGRYGLFTEGCYNVTFDGVRTMNFQGYGFDPHGQKKTGIYGDILIIKNCVSTHNNWDGFTLDQTKNIYVVNCTSRSNGRHGFNIVTGSKNVTLLNITSFVDGYYFPTGSGCGVQVQNNQGYPTRNVTIKNALNIDPKKAGVCLNGVSNINIIGNRNYGKTCFRFENSVNVSVNNNTCFNANTQFIISKSTNIHVNNTLNLTDTLSTYSGHNLTIIVGYSNNAHLKVRPNYDAYSIFQQAFDEIKANGKGKLYIEEGEYILSSFLEVGDNVTVIGAGMNKTILKLQNIARPWWIPGTGTKRSGFLRSTHCVNLRFYNLTIDGNKAFQNTDKYSKYGRFGFFTEACDNVFIDGMAIVNFQGYGFDPHGIKASKTWSVNLTIINSYAGNNDWDGYTIDQSTNVLIANNTAFHNGRHGFNIVTGSFNVTLFNNTATDNGYFYYHGNEGCGIAVQNNLKYGTRDIHVKLNTLTHSKDAGVCLNDVVNVMVQQNTVYRNNTTPCIKTINVTSTVVSNNTCISNLIKSPPLPTSPPKTPKPPPNKSSALSYNNGRIIISLVMPFIVVFIL